MKVTQVSYPLEGTFKVPPSAPQVMAIGYFDGVHLGHQEVIRHALDIGKSTGIPVSLMTFHPHPKEVLGHSENHRYLTPLDEKLDIFAELGVDHTYIFAFDLAFSRVSPKQFIQDILFPLHVGIVVVGFNFTFGHKGAGTPGTLETLSSGHIKVEIVNPYRFDGDKVSSTLIREQLQLGHIQRANLLLGHNYSVTGIVVQGEGRGRSIGIPTANMEPDKPYIIPGNGVYAVKVVYGETSYNGVMNIGYKPTFVADDPVKTLEVHILRFGQMIYGERIRVQFVAFLRHEHKFESVGHLIQQIQKDIHQAELLFDRP